MRFLGRLQAQQFALRIAELGVEGELDANLIQFVADPLQARLSFDQSVLGEVSAKLRLEAVEIRDEVELDVTQQREPQ